MRREENFTDQKSLNVSSLKTDYLNLDSSISVFNRDSEGAHAVQTECTFCGGVNNLCRTMFRKDKKGKVKNSRG